MSQRIDTMQEWLDGLHQYINKGKLTQDADLPWIVQLETMVLERARAPIDAAAAAGTMPPGSGGAPPSFGSPGPTPMGPGMSPGGGMYTGGLSPGPQMPNADELRRVLSQS